MKLSKSMSDIVAATATLCCVATVGVAQSQNAQLESIAQFFATANIVEAPSIVPCKLSGGTETDCFSITVKAEPQAYTPGPWCPTNTSDDASAGGIWFHDGDVVDVDGAFIENLSTLYNDTNWQLFDETSGDIRFTGTLEACEAAARPDVDEAYQNYCVQCLPEYMPDDASMTYVIPLTPQPTDTPARTGMNGSGLAYNGVRLDGPAPVEAILGAYTVAPFDDCGGHVNTHVGYHYHAATDCLTADAPEGTSDLGSQIGIAMDGYPIFPYLDVNGNAAEGLDQCNGQTADGIGYHYRAGAPGSNAILGCLAAETGCALEGTSQECDATARPRRP